MKDFNKGDIVTFINNWDERGTFTYRDAVVYSCGNKRMVLTDANTGEEMGRNYSPNIGEGTGTFPRMTDDEAQAHCIAAAEAYIPKAIERYENCIKSNEERWGPNPGYEKAIRDDIAEMHAPTASSYAAQIAIIAANIAAKYN